MNAWRRSAWASGSSVLAIATNNRTTVGLFLVEAPETAGRTSWAAPRSGGDGWESNPPGTAQHRPTDGFEDRERHQPPNIPSGVSLPQVGRAFFGGPPGASLNSKPAPRGRFRSFLRHGQPGGKGGRGGGNVAEKGQSRWGLGNHGGGPSPRQAVGRGPRRHWRRATTGGSPPESGLPTATIVSRRRRGAHRPGSTSEPMTAGSS